jgi:hypothetical protein
MVQHLNDRVVIEDRLAGSIFQALHQVWWVRARAGVV